MLNKRVNIEQGKTLNSEDQANITGFGKQISLKHSRKKKGKDDPRNIPNVFLGVQVGGCGDTIILLLNGYVKKNNQRTILTFVLPIANE